ncbi:rod shape-determining protein RodA [Proteiniclasticum sp. SCR006]|uniref:Rod shape-determining protein RodA n=1 Tax=Proteiniclasticum aestuarii TaxID=2817862 RepID=A0A939KLK3_9CLOT|nr:FtsW/RodA/SpoVE family cell cycle protein [Proteiniclasticum aestuarii]MBO1265770.1 rod shape-determining protein RodA [Proteiniclasticum aestuarii]
MNLLKSLIIDKKDLKELDFGMLLSAVAILLFGAFNIYTATSSYYAKLQLIWLLLSLGVVYVILLMDYRKVYKIVDVLYWIVVLMLIFVLFTTKVKGAAGWFSIGTRGLQPAEFAKLTTMLMVGKQLHKVDGNINNLKNFITVTIYALIPVILMLLQPEMGITMITFFIVLGIYFVMGLSLKVIFAGFGFIGLAVLVVLKTSFLPSHWSDRLTSFLFNEGSELGINYQLSRSVISIGSGKLTGKFNFSRFLEDMTSGSQSSTQFFNRVPENHTDFIFSVLAENFGLIGGVTLLLLYGYLLFRMIRVARKTEEDDIFGKCIAVGVFSSFLFSILQNIGMTMGIMPISGITLPLVSYGGSSVLTTFIAIAMVLNVGMKKKTTLF